MPKHSENGYLLIFRGTEWHKGLSPEQMQQVVGDWMAWFDRLGREGKVAGGSPLENEGKVISGKGGRVVADGPFAESKEAVGGYFVLTVTSEDEAMEIARQCPGLPYGAIIELRPIACICPVAQDAGVDAAHKSALEAVAA